MDRPIVYSGQIPLSSDLLNSSKNAMIGLSKLAAAILGTGTLVNGLACTPTAPASLSVNVAAGEIYQMAAMDATAYGGLAADVTHTLLKQGISLDTTTLALTAPATVGQSINYLIQATYEDIDSNLVVLPFYNSANPLQALNGQGGNGQSLPTMRKGQCVIGLKAGASANTGTQATPAPDAGYVGLWVVTVAYGQTTITAPNIVAYANAPFVNSSLLTLSPVFGVSPLVPNPGTSDNSLKAAPTALVQALIASLATPGSIITYAGSTVPAGYLAVPTTATNISRATYANLFAAIGTAFGAGDGVTTFGLPYCPTGYTFVQGTIGLLTVGAVISHTHTYSYAPAQVSAAGGGTPNSGGNYNLNTGATGGSANLAAGMGVQYAIKY
jgi:hypothetical protein